jgi:hypothetical protein
VINGTNAAQLCALMVAQSAAESAGAGFDAAGKPACNENFHFAMHIAASDLTIPLCCGKLARFKELPARADYLESSKRINANALEEKFARNASLVVHYNNTLLLKSEPTSIRELYGLETARIYAS